MSYDFYRLNFCLIFIFVFFAVESATIANPCSSDDWYCGPNDNRKCIPKEWRCDKSADCEFGSDENNCKPIDCHQSEFRCFSGDQCIPKVLKCDHIPHCFDESDERNCTKQSLSKTLLEKRCDPATQFDCENDGHECIPLSKMCDGYMDCTRRQDEFPGEKKENCLRNDCKLGSKNGGCSHICLNRFVERICLCPSGFKLGSDNRTCYDIDECSESPLICSQKCINLEGSYKCVCHKGYIKDPNNSNRCIAPGRRDIMFTANGAKLGFIDLNKNSAVSFFSLSRNVKNFVVDIKNENTMYVLHSDSEKKYCQLQVVSNWKKLQTDKNVRVLHSLTGTFCFGLSYDWTRNLLFWTSVIEGSIYVTDVKTGYTAKLIIGDLKLPYYIVVDPDWSRLFWVEMGHEQQSKNDSGARIMTAEIGELAMMKNKMKIQKYELVSSEWLHWPTDLVIDYSDRRLYWSDLKPGSISYLELDKLQFQPRHLVLENKQIMPYSIMVFENKIFWADWKRNEILSVDKSGGHNLTLVIKVNRPFSLVALNQIVQPIRINNQSSACKSHPCSHICLPPPRHSSKLFICICPNKFVLNRDDQTCVLENEFLIFPINKNRPYLIIGVTTALIFVLIFAITVALIFYLQPRKRFSNYRSYYDSVFAVKMSSSDSKASQLSELLS